MIKGFFGSHIYADVIQRIYQGRSTEGLLLLLSDNMMFEHDEGSCFLVKSL